MTNIYIFSQNVKLDSFEKLRCKESDDENIFLTTHMLFDYEKDKLNDLFSNCTFLKFADFLSDSANEWCDFDAYDGGITIGEYYSRIKRMKNQLIAERIVQRYPNYSGFLCSDDLGIDATVWRKYSFEPTVMEYFYDHPSETNNFKKELKQILKKSISLRKINNFLKEKKAIKSVTDEIYVASDEKKKYVFIGKMSRVAYRIGLSWQKSDEEFQKIRSGKFESKEKCQYLTSLHESMKCVVPDKSCYDVRYIQDGYLPPNYSSRYLKYKPKNVSYYSWDELGKRTFEYHNLAVDIMPFRKKLYMPNPVFNKNIKNILVATSGPGDWTAQKNRSDEDLMLQAFVEVAKQLPNVHIVYRCHPTWVHPEHAGVNSINRAAEYIQSTGLTNITVSTNIPKENMSSFVLSFSRGSLEEDLKNADMVFGEHSVSMIDGAFQHIPFASVNLTNRRDLFCGLTEMGFPHCTSVKEIIEVINKYNSSDFKKNYSQAVDKYNKMTDVEE